MHPIEAHAVARAIHRERLAEADRARRERRLRESSTGAPSRGRRTRRRFRLRLFAATPVRGWRTA